MATTKGKTHSKAKPEAVVAYPGKRAVKNTAAAKGGNKRPADPMTGGGKVKSAAGQSEPVLKSERIGKSPTKRKAGASLPREGSLRDGSGTTRAALSRQGAASAAKEGMAKSSKRKEPKIATATAAEVSRKKPAAQPARGAAKPKGRTATSAKTTKPTQVGSAKMPGAKPGAQKRGGGRIGAGKAAGAAKTSGKATASASGTKRNSATTRGAKTATKSSASSARTTSKTSAGRSSGSGSRVARSAKSAK